MTPIRERHFAHLYIQKEKQLRNVFKYQKPHNSCYVFIYKKQDTLRYAIFHENFEVGIYIQKA